MSQRFVLPFQSVYNTNGSPYDGAKLYFYDSGTSTPKDTFTDEPKTIANTNPVIANGFGTFGDIFLEDGDYKVVLKDKYDLQVWEANPVSDDGGTYSSVVTTIANLRLLTGEADQSISLLGHTAVGDGGGGDFYWDATSTDADNDGTIIKVTGVTTGRWIRLYSGAINVKWFGAKGDFDYTSSTGTDDTAAIQAAIDYAATLIDADGHYFDSGVGIPVLLPSSDGDFLISSAISLDGHQIILTGDAGFPRIVSNSTTANVIEIPSGFTGCSVRNLRILKIGTTTAGGGVVQLGVSNLNTIEKVETDNCYDGFYLTGCGWSRIRDCDAFNSVRNGFMLYGDADNTQLQWYFTGTCLAQNSGGSGLYISGDNTGTASQWTVGTIRGFATTSNDVNGITVLGFSGTPIHALRFDGCFIGTDTGFGISLDTHGRYHTISNSFFEIAGKHGLFATANNELLQINSSFFKSNGWNGIDSSAEKTLVNGCISVGNGTATGGASVQKGVALKGQYSSFTGGTSSNFAAVTSQLYGVSVENTDCVVTSSQLSGNTTGAILFSGGATNANTDVDNNNGYVTKNSGTATIASGTTAIAVTHGLPITPTLDYISVVMGESPTNDPGNVWVDTITSTQFTINCRADPGASNLDVAWRAEIT